MGAQVMGFLTPSVNTELVNTEFGLGPVLATVGIWKVRQWPRAHSVMSLLVC